VPKRNQKPGSGAENLAKNIASRSRHKKGGKIPIPISFNVPYWWTRWQSSRWHLFPVRLMCRATAGVPEKLRSTVEIKQMTMQFRAKDTCIACFNRYIAENERRRAHQNPPKPLPSLHIEETPPEPQTDTVQIGGAQVSSELTVVEAAEIKEQSQDGN
jgi:hypothetical protein